MKRKFYPSTIRPWKLYSRQEKLNTKFSLVLEKEKALGIEFPYSINCFERIITLIEFDKAIIFLTNNDPKLAELKKKGKTNYFDSQVLDRIKNKAGIYMFVNKVNKKFYIGKANDLYARIQDYTDHNYLLASPNSKILKALLKYKFNNFAFSIIEYCDIQDLKIREQFYIELLCPQYNIRTRTCKEFYTKIKHIQI